jgi:cysteamine dioxygenase
LGSADTRASSRYGSLAEGIGWDALLEEIAHAAEDQYHWFWNQEAYVQGISAIGTCLSRGDASVAKILAEGRLRDTHPNFLEVEHSRAFEVMLISFERGDSIPIHDHADVTGVTLCVKGELAVQHYDICRGRPEEGSCLLRKVSDSLLIPGRTSTFTVKGRNVHGLQATRPCQLIDIFTPPFTPARVRRSHSYILDAEVTGQPNVFHAISCC